MKDNKTIREHLQTLPEPARTNALRNLNCSNPEHIVGSLTQAINMAFIWEETPEGADYWLTWAKYTPYEGYVKRTHLYKVTETDTPYIGKVSNSHNVADIARQCVDDGTIGIYESFYILTMSRNNTVTGVAKISQGAVAGTLVDGKLVAKYAVDMLASHVVLIHNHPSGNLKPSLQDINITRKIKEGLKMLDIQVLDHIILTEDGYYSFADEGKI